MLGNAVESDLSIEPSDLQQKYAGKSSARSNQVLYIGLLISAIFHGTFLYAFVVDRGEQQEQKQTVFFQEFEVQLQVVAEPETETPEPGIEPTDPEALPETSADEIVENIEVPEEIHIGEVDVIADGQSMDLSEQAIENVVAKLVQEDANIAREFEEAVDVGYVDGFDPRFRQKLIDSHNAQPPPKEPELATWKTGSGQTVVEISDTHCMKSVGQIIPAKTVGSPAPAVQWGIPYKCGKDAGDRMMDRVNARLSAAGF